MYTYGGDEEFGGLTDAALGATSLAIAGPQGGSLEVEESIGTERAFSSLLSVIKTTGKDKKGRTRPEAALAVQCLPLVYQGYQRAEIAKRLGEDASKVGRALSFLRRSANTWKDAELG